MFARKQQTKGKTMSDMITLGMLTASCPRTENSGLEETVPAEKSSIWKPLLTVSLALVIASLVGFVAYLLS